MNMQSTGMPMTQHFVNKENPTFLERWLFRVVALALSTLLLFPKLTQDIGTSISPEDLLYPIYGTMTLLLLIVEWQRIARYLYMPVIYFSYALIATLFSLFNNLLQKQFVLIYFKELQYAVIGIAVFLLMSKYQRYRRSFMRLLSFLFSANILFGFAMILLKVQSYYGIRSICTNAPSLSGLIFFYSCVWFVIYYQMGKRTTWTLLMAIGGAVCTVATVSRSSIAGLSLFLFIAGSVMILKDIVLPFFVRLRMRWEVLVVSIVMLIVISLFVGSGSTKFLFDRVSRRLQANSLENSAEVRGLAWRKQTRDMQLIEMVFGNGRGYANSLSKKWTLSVDSQYVRNYMEVGILGSVLWFAMLLSFVFSLIGDRLMIFYVAFLLGFMVLMYPLEAMLTTKGGTLFWVITMVLLAMKYKTPLLSGQSAE